MKNTLTLRDIFRWFLYLLIPFVLVFLIFGRLLTDTQQYSVGEAIWFETYPIAQIQKELVESKSILLWDNTLGSGASAIGNPLYTQTYPPTYLLNLFFDNQLYATRVSYFFHLFLGTFFFFILTRRLRVNLVVGVVGALLYLYNSVNIVTVQNGFRSDLIMITWWPLMFLLIIGALTKKSFFLAALAGLSFSMLIHGGAVYNTVFATVSVIIFFTSFVVLNFFKYLKKNRLNNVFRNTKIFIVFIVFAFMFSAPKLLPSSEFIKHSVRESYSLQQAEDDVTPEYYKTILKKLGSEYIPRLDTDRSTSRLFKGFHIALFGFAAMSMLNSKRRKVALPLFVVVVVSLFASFGSSIPIDIYAIFYRVVPFFKSMHYASRFLIVIYLAIPLLSVFGMELVVSLGKQVEGTKKFLYFFLCLTVATLSLSVIIKQARRFVDTIYFSEYRQSEVTSYLTSSFSKQDEPSRMANYFSSSGFHFYLYDSVNRSSFDILAPIYGQIRPYFYDAYYFNRDGLDETFKMWRILNTKYLVMWDEYKDKYLESSEAKSVIELTETDLAGEQQVAILEINSPRYRVSFVPQGVLYLSKNSDKDIFSAKSARQFVYDPNFTLNEVSLYNNPLKDPKGHSIETLSLFNAVFVGDMAQDGDQIANLLDDYKSGGGQIIENISQLSASSKKKPLVEITNYIETPGYLSLTLNTDSNGYLVYSSTYDPDWRSFLNGKRVPTYMADSYVKGVVIPSAGEYQVVMQYYPRSFYLGLVIALVGFVLFFLLFAKLRSQKRQFGAGRMP